MELANEISPGRQAISGLPGSLTLGDLPGIYRGLCRGLPQREAPVSGGEAAGGAGGPEDPGLQWCMDLLNAVVGLGHWRIVTRETFFQEVEDPGGLRYYEAGYDVSVQLGNWTARGFEVLAETPGTPGGHRSGSRSEARRGALATALKKTLSFFGIGCAPAPGAGLKNGPALGNDPDPGNKKDMSKEPAINSESAVSSESAKGNEPDRSNVAVTSSESAIGSPGPAGAGQQSIPGPDSRGSGRRRLF